MSAWHTLAHERDHLRIIHLLGLLSQNWTRAPAILVQCSANRGAEAVHQSLATSPVFIMVEMPLKWTVLSSLYSSMREMGSSNPNVWAQQPPEINEILQLTFAMHDRREIFYEFFSCYKSCWLMTGIDVSFLFCRTCKCVLRLINVAPALTLTLLDVFLCSWGRCSRGKFAIGEVYY